MCDDKNSGRTPPKPTPPKNAPDPHKVCAETLTELAKTVATFGVIVFLALCLGVPVVLAKWSSLPVWYAFWVVTGGFVVGLLVAGSVLVLLVFMCRSTLTILRNVPIPKA